MNTFFKLFCSSFLLLNIFLPSIFGDNNATIDAGSSHSLFIKSDGSLWGMGYNRDGRLGDGTTTDRSTPVKIDENVSEVTAVEVTVYSSRMTEACGRWDITTVGN